MNWGIVSLLGTILVVLGGIAGFFVGLARRAAALSRAAAAGAATSVPEHTRPNFSPVSGSLTRHPTLDPRDSTLSCPRA
jgi:hypothetical protein